MNENNLLNCIKCSLISLLSWVKHDLDSFAHVYRATLLSRLPRVDDFWHFLSVEILFRLLSSPISAISSNWEASQKDCLGSGALHQLTPFQAGRILLLVGHLRSMLQNGCILKQATRYPLLSGRLLSRSRWQMNNRCRWDVLSVRGVWGKW